MKYAYVVLNHDIHLDDSKRILGVRFKKTDADDIALKEVNDYKQSLTDIKLDITRVDDTLEVYSLTDDGITETVVEIHVQRVEVS